MNTFASLPQEEGIDQQKKDTLDAKETLPQQLDSTQKRAELAGDTLAERNFGTVQRWNPEKMRDNPAEDTEYITAIWAKMVLKLSEKKSFEEIKKNPRLLLAETDITPEEYLAAQKLNLAIEAGQFNWEAFCQSLEKQKKYAKKEGTWLEKLGNKISEEAKEHPKLALGLSVATGLVTGLVLTYLGYKIGQKVRGTIREKTEKPAAWLTALGFGESVKKAQSIADVTIASVVSVGLGLAAIKGGKRIFDWLDQAKVKQEDLDQLEQSVTETAKKSKEGAREAVQTFIEEHNPVPKSLQKASDRFQLPRLYLYYIAGKTLNEFREDLAEKQDDAIAPYSERESELLGLIDSPEALRLLEEEYGQIPLGEQKIGEVLAVLERGGLLEAAAYVEETEPKEEEQKAAEEKLGGEEYSRTKRALGELEKLPEEGDHRVWRDAGLDLVEAATRDGLEVAVEADKIWLIGKDFTLFKKASVNLYEELHDIVLFGVDVITGGDEVHLKDLAKARLEKYEDPDQILLFGGGATLGAIRAKLIGKSVWKGAFVGGLGSSYTFVKTHLDVGSTLLQGVTRLGHGVAEVTVMNDPLKILSVRLSRLRWHRSALEYYWKLAEGHRGSSWNPGNLAGKAYERLNPGRAEKRLLIHMTYCLEELEALGIQELDGQPLPSASALASDANARDTFRRQLKSFDSTKFHGEMSAHLQKEHLARLARRTPDGRLEALRRLGITDPDQLKHLVVDDGQAPTGEEVLELGINELDQLLELAEKHPKIQAVLRLVLTDIKYLRLANALLQFLKSSGKVYNIGTVFLDIHEFSQAENKTDFLMRSGSTLTAAFVGQMLVRGAVQGGTKAGIIGALVGAGAGVSVGMVWDRKVTPVLDKNFPDRNEFWNTWVGQEISDQVRSKADISAGWDAYKYYFKNWFGWGTGVDDETSPQEYLSEEVRFPNPFAFALDQIFKGGPARFLYERFTGKAMFESHQLRSLDDLLQAISQREEKLQLELQTKVDPEDREEIKKELSKLEDMKSGKWLIETGFHLAEQGIALGEVQRQYEMELRQSEFGEDGVQSFQAILKDINQGKREISKNPKKIAVWKYLYDKETKLDNGQEKLKIKFVDFVSAYTNLRVQEAQLAKITQAYQEKGLLGGEQKEKEATPREENIPSSEDPEALISQTHLDREAANGDPLKENPTAA